MNKKYLSQSEMRHEGIDVMNILHLPPRTGVDAFTSYPLWSEQINRNDVLRMRFDVAIEIVLLMHIKHIISLYALMHDRYVVTSCTRWWWWGAAWGYDALNYRKIRHGDAGRLGAYEIISILHVKFARFLFEFTVKALVSPFYPQTEVILMCTEHLRMTRYVKMSYSQH